MVKYVKAIKDFSGGLSEVANDNVPDNCLITAKNVVPGDGYGIARASGTVPAFDPIWVDSYPSGQNAAGPVVMMIELAMDDETHIIAATEERNGQWTFWDRSYNDVLEKYTWTSISDGAHDHALQINPILSWFYYDEKLFWVDGTAFRYYPDSEGEINDVPNTYHSSDTTFWAHLQTSISVEEHYGRWFFATPDNDIIWSEVGYYDKFITTHVSSILPGVRDSIKALYEFNDSLLIFLERSVYNLSGSDFVNLSDITLTKLSVESGTKWPKSIKTISNAVLYLGDNGVYKLNIPYFSSQIAATNISEKQASKRLTADGITDVYAEVFEGVYYISLRGHGGIKEYRYYIDQKSWWGEYTQQAYCYIPKLTGGDHLYLGCAKGQILYYDSASTNYYNENGAATSIPVEVITKGYDVVGGTVIDAKVKRIFVVLKQYDAEHSTFSVQVKTDYLEGAWEAQVDSMYGVINAVLQDVTGDESLVWSEGMWSQAYWGWIDTVTKMFQLNRKCKRIQFKFMDSSQDNPLMIYGVAMQFKKKKAKGSRLGVSPSERFDFDN